MCGGWWVGTFFKWIFMERDKRRERLKVLRRIRNIGMAMTGIGGGISGAPGLLPPILGQAALYLIVVGTVITVGCQAVINDITDDGEGDGFGGFGGMDGFGGFGGYGGYVGAGGGLWGR